MLPTCCSVPETSTPADVLLLTMLARAVAVAFEESADAVPANSSVAPAAMVAVIPCLVLVLLFHRRVITGLTEGLVKG